MSEKMEIWEAVCRPPLTALKPIKGGRLTGKTDISPQWRYKCMTEQFGMCGVGWKYTIDRLWTEQGVDGVVFSFAQVSVYVHDPRSGQWSEAIPGIGGHKMIESEKAGLYNNDECFKMSVTDAMGVALKMLGVAADIYLGNFDGSKYLTPPEEEVRKDAERQKQLREDARKTGLAILKVAAEKGEHSLKLAWESLAEPMRVACKDDKEALKQQAKQVDAAKVGKHATANA